MPVPEPTTIRNRGYWIDLAIRFALGLTFAFTAGVCLRSFIGHINAYDPMHPEIYRWGQAFSTLAVGLYALMVACLYVVRLRPVSKFAGALPCAAAILGGFLMSGLLLLPMRQDLPLWARLFACVLVIIGNLFAVAIMLRLGRSFSILPESRKLVTQGPYAVVRHPLYLAEAITTLGVVINFLSPWALLLVAAQIILQLVRIHYEEKVLQEHFPEYKDYAKKTWRLIPGIY